MLAGIYSVLNIRRVGAGTLWVALACQKYTQSFENELSFL